MGHAITMLIMSLIATVRTAGKEEDVMWVRNIPPASPGLPLPLSPMSPWFRHCMEGSIGGGALIPFIPAWALCRFIHQYETIEGLFDTKVFLYGIVMIRVILGKHEKNTTKQMQDKSNGLVRYSNLQP